MRKAAFLVGLGTGYVLGARSGRERYDQIMGKVERMWKNPRVQETAEQAQNALQDTAGQAGHAIKDKVASVTSSGDDQETGSDTEHGKLTATG